MSRSRFPPGGDDRSPSGTPQSSSSMAATVQHLRQYLNSHSSGNEDALETVEREMLRRLDNSYEQRPERRNRSAFALNDSDPFAPLVVETRPPFDPFGSAIDSLPANQRDAALSGLRRAVVHLAEASTNLTNNLTRSLPQSRLSESTSQQTPSEFRAKRRKLNSENRQNTGSPKYGHFGQVVPGALDMEIASCDGGRYEPDGETSWPQNVLVNDSSVYCTKSDRCNIILQHQGETPFSLKKLVIRAPKSGFDAPIQQGMVFVSMSSDDLLARTAQYQIVYTAAEPRQRRRPRASRQHRHLQSHRSPPGSLGRMRTIQRVDFESDEIPPLIGPDGTLIGQSGLRVTTNFEENADEEGHLYQNHNGDEEDSGGSSTSSEDDDTLSPRGTLNGPLATFEPATTDSDDSAEESRFSSRARYLTHRQVRRTLNMLRQRDRRRLVPSLIEPSAVPPDRGLISDAGGAQQGTEVLKPHAKFFIERGKSTVTIKFDPPASGRFILIKLWSPYSGGNIDIQSIVAHGFAGPRFFPSMDLR